MRVRPRYVPLLIDYNQVDVRVRVALSLMKAQLPIKSDSSAFPSMGPPNTHHNFVFFCFFFIAVFFDFSRSNLQNSFQK